MMRSLHLFHAPRRRLQGAFGVLHPPTSQRVWCDISGPFAPHVPYYHHAAQFSTTRSLLAKNKGREKRDMRVVLLRYHLQHPRVPRPLRFSRMRALRHWTIHRAWQLYRAKQRRAHEVQLQRQYNSMREACEALRLMGEDGLAVAEGPATPGGLGVTGYLRKANGQGGPDKGAKTAREALAAAEQKDIGKLYRVAMSKEGVWQGVPIEYAKIQTDTPSRDGWNHSWKRGSL